MGLIHPHPFTGIQQHYAQGTVVGQQPRQVGRAQPPDIALFTGRGHVALIAEPIPAGKITLAEEVEYMPVAVLHRLLQMMPGWALQPGQFHQSPHP